MRKQPSSSVAARSIPSTEGIDRRKSIFVSSTFRDMQTERDMIHNIVSPKVNEFARKHGGFVNFIDLRWGIDTSTGKDSMDKVLKICLNEIDLCHPYFIGLIGDNYGSMPNPDKMKKAAKGHGIKNISDLNTSITELEIEYGVLSGEGPFDASFFYLRGPLNYDLMPEDIRKKYNDDKLEKLNNLKKKIRENADLHPEVSVSGYEAVWDEKEQKISCVKGLAEKMTAEVISCLSKEWGVENDNDADLPWQEQSMIPDRYIITSKNSCFIGRESTIKDCTEFINDPDTPSLLTITGEPGVGKSTFMARLTDVLPTENIDTISIFCGSGPRTNSIIDIIKNISYRLELLLGKTEHFGDEGKTASASIDGFISNRVFKPESKTTEEWFNNIMNLAYEHRRVCNRPIALLVDALDQLSPLEREDSLRQLSRIVAPGLSIIVTFIEDSQIAEPDNITTWTLPLISEKEILETTKRVFRDNHKELYDVVSEAIIRKKGASNHLLLSMILQRLMMIDSEDLSDLSPERWSEDHKRLMLDMIEFAPENVSDLSSHIIKEALTRVSSKAVEESVKYLAVARRGLRETDLEKIIEDRWNTVDFRTFLLYLSTFFTERFDGRIDFSHRIIREGLLKNIQEDQEIHADILDHLKSLDIHDLVKLSETVYHACRKDDSECLCSFLSSAYDEELSNVVAPYVLEEISNDSETVIEAAGIAGEKFEEYHSCAEFFLSNMYNMRNVSHSMLHQLIDLFTELASSLCEITPTALNTRALSLSFRNIGDIFLLSGKITDATENYDRCLILARLLVSGSRVREARENLLDNLKWIGGSIISFTRDVSSAIKYYKESLIIAEDLASEFKTLDAEYDLLNILNWIGDATAISDPKNALEYYKKSLDIAQSFVFKLEMPEAQIIVSYSLSKIGDTLASLNDIPGAVESYEESLTIARLLASNTNEPAIRSALAESLWGFGHVLVLSEEIDDAVKCYKESLEINRSIESDIGTPEARRRISIGLKEMGNVLVKLGILRDALQYYEESISMCRDLVSELDTLDSQHDLSLSLACAGDVLLEMKDRDGALQYYDESLLISVHLASRFDTPEAHHAISFSLNRIGDALLLSEDGPGALRYYKGALDIVQHTKSGLGDLETQHDISYCLDKVGDALFVSGDAPGALQHHEASLEIRRFLASELETSEAQEELLISLNKIGAILTLSGSSNAVRYREEATAVEMSLKGNWEYRRDLAAGQKRMGEKLASAGDLSGSSRYYEESAATRESMFSEPDVTEKYIRCLSNDKEEIMPLESDSPESLSDTASSLDAVGKDLLDSGDLSGAIEYFNKSIEIRRYLASRFRTFESLSDLVISSFSLGRLFEALEDLSAIKYYEESAGALSSLASEFGYSELKYGHDLFEVLMGLSNSIQLFCKVPGFLRYKESLDNTMFLVSDIMARKHGGVSTIPNPKKKDDPFIEKRDVVLREYEESLTVARSQSSALGTIESHRNLATVLEEIGEALLHSGGLRYAAGYYEEAAGIRRSLFSNPDAAEPCQDLFDSLINTGFAFEEAEDFLSATKYYEEAFGLFKSKSSEFTDVESRRTMSVCLERIGYNFERSGYLPGAIKYCKEALAIKKTIAFEFKTHESLYDLTSCLETLGRAFLESNDLPQATEYYEEHLSVRKSLASEDEGIASQQGLSACMECTGNDFLACGHVSQAISYYDRALDIYRALASESKTPDSLEDLRDTLTSIIETFEEHEMIDEARKYIEELESIE